MLSCPAARRLAHAAQPVLPTVASADRPRPAPIREPQAHGRLLAGGGQAGRRRTADGLRSEHWTRSARPRCDERLAGQARQQPGDRLRPQRPAGRHRSACRGRSLRAAPTGGRAGGVRPRRAAHGSTRSAPRATGAPGGPGPPDRTRDGRPAVRPAQRGLEPGTSAAASSMARGMPSSWAHTCATAAELSADSSKAGLAAPARAGTAPRPRTRRRPPRPSRRPAPRRHREDQLTGDIQAFPAGGQEPHPQDWASSVAIRPAVAPRTVLAVGPGPPAVTVGERGPRSPARGWRSVRAYPGPARRWPGPGPDR